MNTFNPHTILGLAIPTNEPTTCKEYFLDSLHYLKEVAPITTILFNFQKPWTQEEIDQATAHCKSLGFEVRYSFNEYNIEGKGKVPFNQIRNDACKLMPDAKFFALTDDDFKYRGPSNSMDRTAGQQYVETIDYLTRFKNCGLVLMGGTMFKKIPRYHIGPVDLENTFITGRGYVMRSMGEEGLTLPKDCLHLVGSDEEKVSAGFRLSKGLYPAKFGFSRTAHYEYHSKTVVSGENMYGWNADDILDENNSKYIREHYNPKFKGKGFYNVVKAETYFENGGIDVYNEDTIKEYTVNYKETNTQELIDAIIERCKSEN